MGRLRKAQREELRALFGARVSFRRIERKLYGHDMAALPSLFQAMVGRTVPDAVVQPVSEAELTALVRWASSRGVALTPRGKGSSGYGGVLPVRRGVVVDFQRLDAVLDVDGEAMTATVQAGAVWERLEERLARAGLAARLYPTSYPASTVGGWLAQGGAGIGSYEAGWFRDNVVSARVVLADGTVREFAGPDLELVSDAEGITGLISTVTLRVQPYEEVGVLAVGSPDAHALQRLAELLVNAPVPVWSLVFINPLMAELKNRAPLLERHGQPVEERVLLPAAYITTLAFRAGDGPAVREALPRVLASCDAELLSERIAAHEWKQRSRLMAVKRLGPSLVPAEVVVPLEALGDVMTEIERKVDQPIVQEGLVIRNGGNGGPEAVILGFIPSDQRKFRYNLVFGLVLTIIKIAEAHGGRPYATGLHFAAKANTILGPHRTRRLRAFKARSDPQGILNPGKVVGNGLLGAAVGLTSLFEPLIRPFGNYVATQVGERPAEPIRDIPADVAWYAYSCSQCGYCTEACTQYRGYHWESQTPRGKWFWLREYMAGREPWDPHMVESILGCTTCEACNRACSSVLPIEASWMKLRGTLVTGQGLATFPLFEAMAASLRREGNCWLGRRADRTAWLPDDLAATHGPDRAAPALYLTGCTACYLERDVCIGTARLLDAAGVDFAVMGERESCCGMPMLVAGKTDLFVETLRQNLQAVHDAGARTVVTSCAACDLAWRHLYPEWARKLGLRYDVEPRHYSEIVAERLEAGQLVFPPREGEPLRVAWHDSCHLGRASGVYDAPRRLVAALPNVALVELPHHHDDTRCCGGVVTLIRDPQVAGELARGVLDEVRETGAAAILSLCPCCQLQFRLAGDAGVAVMDLAHLAAEALGHTLPDPLPEVKRLWTAVEAARAMLTPERFAELLVALWPQVTAALPTALAAALRAAQRLPGGLSLARPLFPALFRRALPTVLPRILEPLAERIAADMALPADLDARVRPLLPAILEALAPHMADDAARRILDHLAAQPR